MSKKSRELAKSMKATSKLTGARQTAANIRRGEQWAAASPKDRDRAFRKFSRG